MKQILLSHGGGGEETQRLIKDLFFRYFSNPILEKMEDAAVLEINSKLAFTTDSFTVSPIFFKGGNIGKLAVAGTVNDLAMMGAQPLYMSCSFIIEEGFPFDHLEEIVRSMYEEMKKSGVKIVTGDTKVVPRGSADKIFINTTGIGRIVYDGISASNIQEGDIILVSGTVGDHGACIMAQREGIEMEGDLKSDCATLWPVVKDLIDSGIPIKAMRDPTRGGLSAVLNEWAESSDIGIEIEEDMIPVKDEVQGMCELLGLDPLTLANEGKLIIAVPEDQAEKTLEVLRDNPLGREAQIIGRAISDYKGKVILKSSYGSKRILEPPAGELLPRIC
ncbi:MAG TPA: hydrogenase expression/formation protein HypE [Persephonella sp.]|uniref:Hydrogenase expression/formation protein HypE n=1 Tax=Persephonella marina (strain DSM 14350 / EX-H1) TaxID=123214 RepID=C0QQ56_PERMH|nr:MULTISPECIES: hydrogenase expression/formation protein HypE [Persephonella]ACO04139.1 hydrogenase expression/formation protein HypE [Persephonella marina EX-H1]HCB69583.1 hydrogenase expression/formation protein HypE [Persephonella sp.]